MADGSLSPEKLKRARPLLSIGNSQTGELYNLKLASYSSELLLLQPVVEVHSYFIRCQYCKRPAGFCHSPTEFKLVI